MISLIFQGWPADRADLDSYSIGSNPASSFYHAEAQHPAGRAQEANLPAKNLIRDRAEGALLLARRRAGRAAPHYSRGRCRSSGVGWLGLQCPRCC
eukprot:COSAG01_NODE_5318_length_4337_cov_11.889571_1_plen_96_part_00